MFLTSELSKTVKKSKRIGRGGSRGKNSGHGNKGQIKRAGKTRVGFEGGGRSFIRRTPKYKGYNFSGKDKRQIDTLTLVQIEKSYKDGEEVSLKTLKEKLLIDENINKVRIVKSGTLSKKLTFQEDGSIYLTKGVKSILKK